MIELKIGDIFSEETEALVNTVNCVGVMGRGIALQFKKIYPKNFKSYAAACKREDVRPGEMFITETGELTNPRYIINFPTKRHWRGKTRMEDIDTGLLSLTEEIRSRQIRSIAIPPLGCGLGGLSWSKVRPRIETALKEFSDLKVVIFEPGGAQKGARANRSTDVPKMTSGRAALLALIDRYLGGLLDPFITLLEVHKLMYFMQAANEPLRLKFREALYGPYAENLRHVLHAIEGHFLSGYADGGDAPDKQLHLVPGALKDAQTFLKGRPETQANLNRVCDLVDGFESPFGLELLSTVHWVATKEKTQSVKDIVKKTYTWNERKQQMFSERQIKLATDVLIRRGWIQENFQEVL